MLNTFTLMYCWIIRGLKIAAVLFAAVLLLELSFRHYIIDFYKPELNLLNNALFAKDEKHKTVLVLGDSFSAHTNSYVYKLQGRLPYTFVNSSVSGTGIMEASFMAPSRIKSFKPDVVLYQIYLGNDFLDIRHRPNGETTILRRVYHAVSDYVRVIKFLNYRLGQLRASTCSDFEKGSIIKEFSFSIEHYTPRQKAIFRREPHYLEDVLQLKNGREKDFEVLVSRLHKIEEQIDENCRLIILLVPHCAQVSDTYNARMKLLGSKSEFSDSNEFYKRIENEFSEHTVINSLSTFQKLDQETNRIYLENDPHLSDYGQAVLADLMRPNLDGRIER